MREHLRQSIAIIVCCQAVFATAGCDTRCVGPECEVPLTSESEVLVETGSPVDTDPSDEREEALAKVRDCDVVRWFRPEGNASSVQIAGSFNDWTPADMTGPDAGGWYQANLGPLAPGLYPYKYLVNGTWEEAIPDSSTLQWDGGVENRSLDVGDCTKPLLRVRSAQATPDGALEVIVDYALGKDASPLNIAGLNARVGNQTVTPAHDAEAQTLTVTATGLAPGKHTVRVEAADEGGRVAENSVFTPLWVESTPFEWTDGTMYLVFVDRFRNGDGESSPVDGVDARANYNGGDLLGVLQALQEGWFTDLGIRSIWLSPLYDNAEGAWQGVSDSRQYAGYHGYWPVEARAVESRYGDAGGTAAERLHEVVDEAHRQGIRVVLDGVFNHVHEHHTYRSSEPSWFGDGCVCGAPGCGWEEKPIECWFTGYLPDLDHTNPAITAAVVDDTLWWVKEFDLDGLRIDAVKHMHRAMTVNLRHALRDEIERGGGAKVYTVGETFTGGGAYGELTERIGPNEMDAQFDFPSYWTIRSTFAHGGSMADLEGAMRTAHETWGNAPMSPFAGNHDVARLSTEIAGNDDGPWGFTHDRLADGGNDITEAWLIDTLALTLTYTLTQPGVPLLYYGDEIGLAGSGDPDNRRVMSFDPFLSANQRALLSKVQAAGKARRELKGLQVGDWTPLWAEQDMLAYARHTEDQVSIVVLNRNNERQTDIPLQDLLPDGTTLTDRLNPGRSVSTEGGALRMSIGANQAAILAP